MPSSTYSSPQEKSTFLDRLFTHNPQKIHDEIHARLNLRKTTVMPSPPSMSDVQPSSGSHLPFAQVQYAHPRQAAFMRKLFGVHEDTSKDSLPFVPVQHVHPMQAALMRTLFGGQEQEKLASDPRPLQSQVEPTVKISLRRRVTNTLNSPFEYEMTEADRVVL